MIDPLKLSRVLWSAYIDQIKVGLPVYFNYSRQMISDLVFNEFEFSTSDEAFEAFLKTAREFVVVNGKKVAIKDEIYNKNDDLSNVIILIALQIVAADLMTSKAKEYTSDSYYPPLRKLISNELGEEHDIPFEDQAYKKMWDVFKSEIISINSKSIVTFDVVGKGREKNRIYPMSQALLNERDLISLGMFYYKQKDKYFLSQEFNWNSFVVSMSRRISERGRRCIANIMLREAVINQLQIFVETRSEEDLVELITNIKKIDTSFQCVLIEDESEAFFGGDEEFYLKILAQDGSDLEQLVGLERLKRFLEINDYLLFYTSEGIYRSNPRKRYIESIEDIYILSDSDNAVKVLEETIGIKSLDFEIIEIGNIDSYSLFKISDQRINGIEINIVNGVFGKKEEKSILELAGGIRVSNIGHEYFCCFPPTSIIFNGNELSHDSQLIINGNEAQYSAFLDILRLKMPNRYLIEVEGARLALNLSDVNNVETSLGNIVEDRVLQIKKTVLNDSDKGIVGLKSINLHGVIKVSRSDFVSFFIRDESLLVPVSESQSKIVLESIALSKSIGKTHKNFLELFVSSRKCIPLPLFQKLVASDTAA